VQFVTLITLTAGEVESMTDKESKLCSLLRKQGPMVSSKLADLAGLLVFQITATLASLEKRGIISRNDKKWQFVGMTESETPVPSSKAVKLPVGATKGWKIRYRTIGGYGISVFVDPDTNKQYVNCPIAQAELVVTPKISEFGQIFLRELNTTFTLGRRILGDDALHSTGRPVREKSSKPAARTARAG
jgi:hypothetical protein